MSRPEVKLRAALLLGTLPLLGGCAVAAIPVLAGAVVAKKGMDGPSHRQTPAAPKDQRVAVFVGEDAPKASLAPTAVIKTEVVAAAQPAPRFYTVTDAQPAPSPATDAETLSVTRGIAPVPAPVTLPRAALAQLHSAPADAALSKAEPAPAPSAKAPDEPVKLVAKLKAGRAPQPAPAARPTLDASSGYLGLAGYVLPRISSPQSTGVLDVIDANDPLADPRRSQCGGLPPAVMIDLDPGLEVFDPQHAEAQPGLADTLAALRGAGVTVMWSSAVPVEKAEAVHAALARAKLDPDRTDRLLLLKGTGDRKQARRLSATHNWCVLAMAGDRRGDFDEAFDYLKDPETTIPADKLFGDGWFIAPAPIP